MADSIWWTKMLHKDYCAHYCEMSDSEIVADVRRSVASLMMQRSEGSDFGAMMVRMAMERIEAKHETAVSNGQQGGRPRKNQEFTAGATTREGVEFKSDSGDAGNLESATPATISQDAANRKAVGDCKVPTSCNHYESCNHYDQGTDRRISTDEALDLLRAGVTATSQAPVRNGPSRPSVRSTARNSRRPTSREEFHAFVADNDLHEELAEEWYAMHEARGWNDENGNPIKNWRGALKNYCIKVEQKRRTA